MNQYRYLDTDNKVSDYLQSLKDRNISKLGVDLEGEYNLHHYGEHLCLVQIYDGFDSVIIDPQTVRISLIKQFFEDRDLQKIIYDCTGDRTLLFRRYGIAIHSVLDLLPAVELLEFDKKKLSSVLNRVLGLEEKNKKKFQRYNWMKRPVQEDALIYAMEDVKFLIELYDKLMGDLRSKGLYEEYQRINQEIQTRPISRKFIPGLFKKNRFKKLPPESRALMEKLFEIRDEYAERMDLPPNSVVSNEDLFSLSCGQMKAEEIRFSRQVNKSFFSPIQKDFSRALKS